MAKDWKEQLKQVQVAKPVAARMAAMEKKAPPVVVPVEKAGAKVIKRSKTAVVASDAPWYEHQIPLVLAAKSSANGIEMLKTVRTPELSERLKDVLRIGQQIHEACLANKGEGRAVTTARRAAESVINYTKTVQAGVANRDVEHHQLPEVTASMRGYLNELRDSLKKIGNKPEPKPEAVEFITEDAVKHFRNKIMLLDRTNAQHQKRDAFLIELPVIPIFDGIVTADKLAGSGFKVESFGGYPVMLNQRMLAVRHEQLAEKNMDVDTYMSHYMRQIERNEPHGWMAVTPSGVASSKHEVTLYWLMPSRALSAMTQITANSPLRSWGLPW